MPGKPDGVIYVRRHTRFRLTPFSSSAAGHIVVSTIVWTTIAISNQPPLDDEIKVGPVRWRGRPL